MPEYNDELIRSSDGLGEPFSDVLERALSRRQFLKGTVIGAAMVTIGGRAQSLPNSSQLTFQQIAPSKEDRLILPDGYKAQVILKWGDPLTSNGPKFDPKQPQKNNQNSLVTTVILLHFSRYLLGAIILNEACWPLIMNTPTTTLCSKARISTTLPKKW
jgi:hypothetical protein